MSLNVKLYPRTTLCLLALAGALLNLDLFGPQTLAAYFAYTLFAAFTAMIAASQLLSLVRRFPLIDLPAPILWFIALTLFIFMHGLITGSLNLTHYYWVANAALLWGAWGMGRGRPIGTESGMGIKSGSGLGSGMAPAGGSIVLGEGVKRGIALLYKGVSLLALFESLVVYGQQLGVLSSKNPLYACTGTWENPNVTAMFLSLAVYAALQWIKGSQAGGPGAIGRRSAANIILLFILPALLLLQCRTAIIVTVLFLIGHYWAGFNTFIKSKTRLAGWVMTVMAGAVLATAVIVLAFGVKRASSQGRIRIWEASIRLIGQKPFTGQGFGRFEKEYNLFAAKEALPDNDHVNMPYNDFLELGVEGGLGAVALWAAFLISLWRQHKRLGYSVLPIVALLLIQFTNFGFQALPVFALFLLYAAIPPEAAWQEYPRAITVAGPASAKGMTFPTGVTTLPGLAAPPGYLFKQPFAGFRMIGVGCIQGIAFFMLVHQTDLAVSFYVRNKITQNETGADAIEAYSHLTSSLKDFASYDLYFGNAYLKMSQYRPALSQYLQGLESCSNPDMLTKCGYCYQQLRMYDSSRYYYTLVKNMMPYKFGPRLALLKLYQQQGDGPMTKSEAEEIVNMPVKVESNEVVDIKNYARNILEKEKR